jgi:hypothetical protein
MIFNKITFIPKENPTNSEIIFHITDDDGIDKEIPGISGLFIGALTDLDFYVSSQGNIAHLFNFVASELNNPESFLSQLFYISLAAVIQGGDTKLLEEIYKKLDTLTTFIADRQEEMKKGQQPSADPSSV